MKKYIIDSKEYSELPAYLEKSGFMRPVTAENFEIEAVEVAESENPAITAFRAKLAAFIASLNTKYAELSLSIDDTPAAAFAKLEASGVTWEECCTLDMLRRNMEEAKK